MSTAGDFTGALIEFSLLVFLDAGSATHQWAEVDSSRQIVDHLLARDRWPLGEGELQCRVNHRHRFDLAQIRNLQLTTS